jgi:hypothetical protein
VHGKYSTHKKKKADAPRKESQKKKVFYFFFLYEFSSRKNFLGHFIFPRVSTQEQ